MYAFKQIFLVLSLISLASAKKGVSSKTNPEVEARRGLKKSSSKKSSSNGVSGGVFVDPNRGGGVTGGTPNVGGVNRDGTTPGVLIQPPAKPCVPFNEASVWLTAEYPGDAQCRTQNGDGAVSSACCRVFAFADAGGSQKWLLYDSNNQYPDLMCVCGVNTGAPGNSGSTPAVNNPVIPAPVASPVAPPTSDTDRNGGVSGNVVPPTPPGLSVCANPNPTQAELQGRPGMTGCVSSDECPGQRCCSSDTCVCMPTSFLGSAYCA